MASGIFGVALTGLNAAQSGLLTTSHNVANAGTAGYNRQEIRQEASKPLFTGAGFFGRGVEVTNVVRAYSDFLQQSVLSAESAQGYLKGYEQQVNIIDGIVADPTVGLSPSIQDFFKGLQSAASNPASAPARQQMISLANTLASRFRQIDSRLQEVRVGVNEQITSTVSQINALATKIADLNNGIAARTSGAGRDPNDLLDQRDAVIQELNKLVKVTTLQQTDGSLNVAVGSGQMLVLGGTANQFSAIPSATDPESISVSFKQGFSDVPIPDNLLQGGKLGALLNFRTNTLNLAQNALGRVAIGLGRTMNEQHRLGQDLDGNMGGDLFQVSTPRVVNYANNGGNANIQAKLSSVGELTNSDYRVVFTQAGTYDVIRLSDNYKQNATAAQIAAGYTMDGVTFTLTAGAPLAGDSFLVQPTRGGARDFQMLVTDTNRIATAAPFRTDAPLTNVGTGKVDGGVSNSPYDKVTINFTGAGTFTVTDTTTGAPIARPGAAVPLTNASYVWAYPANATVTVNGWQTTISGVPASGDQFVVDKTVASKGTVNTGTGTIGEVVPDPAARPVGAPVPNPPQSVFLPQLDKVRNNVTVTFTSPTQFNVVDNTTGTTLASGLNYNPAIANAVSFNGWSIKLSGAPVAGDVFKVGPNTNASADSRNALALAGLQTANVLGDGSATYQSAYSQMVSTVGNQASEVKIGVKAQDTLVKEANSQKSEFSGVNLDEEAANLLKYQQAYLAASKVISIAQETFKSILNI
ncbi:flagellar hook-associated protein 1 FlgK [Chitinivorax tropicus]|uniref:Flagellar hook-associated protein 1 n=1 Tax=Chitinivorax tropicus TaxID=714531 RepID=A0A840MQK8_9PROT|nr:flagellar hook-associated protein FlgK [Chitinivorax tropicus]MBB5018736.1 flagellar hook-associated protein 1 FlgK [Chitinivorax tropicus]